MPPQSETATKGIQLDTAEQLQLFSDSHQFVMIPWEIATDATLSTNATAAFVALASFGDKSGHCIVRRKVVADRMGCSLNTAKRGLYELRDRGYITVSENYRRNEQRPNLFSVLKPLPRPTGEPGSAHGWATDLHGSSLHDADPPRVCDLVGAEPVAQTKVKSQQCIGVGCTHNTGLDHRTGERYPLCRECNEGTVATYIEGKLPANAPCGSDWGSHQAGICRCREAGTP